MKSKDMAIDVNINNQNKHWILIVLEKIKVAVLAIWRFVALIFGTVWSLIVRFCKGVVWLFKKIWKVLVALIVLAGLVLVSIWGYNAYNLKKAVAEIESRFYSDDISVRIQCAYKILWRGTDWGYEKVSNNEISKRLSIHHDTAFRLIELMAYEGDARCQFSLGCIYDWGNYSYNFINSRDLEKAAYWYHEAALQNHPTACNNLGIAYKEGKGVDVDMHRAVKWLKKSAELGCDYGQRNYGDLLVEGVEVRTGIIEYKTILPKDIEQAKYWWKKAAAQGDEYAKDRLQKLYE